MTFSTSLAAILLFSGLLVSGALVTEHAAHQFLNGDCSSERSSPSIEITAWPAYGTDTPATTGRICGVADVNDYLVVMHVRVQLQWWSKPNGDKRIFPAADGSFSSLIFPSTNDKYATEISAQLMLRAAYDAASMEASGVINLNRLPDLERLANATATVARGALLFGGHLFTTKRFPSTGGTAGPGDNYWSEDTSNLYVDSNGALQMSVHFDGANYFSTEATSLEALGHGLYVIGIRGLSALNTNLVLGAFTWDDESTDAASVHYRELDTEVSKWGFDDGSPAGTNSQFVIQPHGTAGNLERYTYNSTSATSDDTTYVAMLWRPSLFHCYHFDALPSLSVLQHIFHQHSLPPSAPSLYASFNYSGATDIPTSGLAKFHFNFWLLSTANRNLPEMTFSRVNATLPHFSFYASLTDPATATATTDTIGSLPVSTFIILTASLATLLLSLTVIFLSLHFKSARVLPPSPSPPSDPLSTQRGSTASTKTHLQDEYLTVIQKFE